MESDLVMTVSDRPHRHGVRMVKSNRGSLIYGHWFLYIWRQHQHRMHILETFIKPVFRIGGWKSGSKAEQQWVRIFCYCRQNSISF